MLTKMLHENIQKLDLNTMKKIELAKFGTRVNSITEKYLKF